MTFWLLPFTLPVVIQSLVLALLSVGTVWWGKPSIKRGVLRLPQRKGFDRWWDFVTTIGFVQWYSAGSLGDTSLEVHEVDVHVAQFEDQAVLGAVIGGLVSIIDWRIGVGIWASSGPLWLVPNFVTGLVRYGPGARRNGRRLWEAAYYGSEHERSAYAQEYRWDRTGNVVPWRH